MLVIVILASVLTACLNVSKYTLAAFISFIEEGSIGGFDKGLKFRAMTLPDTFIEQDNPKKMYDVAGLNASQISKKVLDILFTKDSIKVVKN